MNIGTLLRKLRDKKRLSSRELSNMIEVAPSTYMDWEHDKTSPSLKSFSKLAGALGVCPTKLMSYFSGQIADLSHDQVRNDTTQLAEIVAHLKHHNNILLEENTRLLAELAKLGVSLTSRQVSLN